MTADRNQTEEAPARPGWVAGLAPLALLGVVVAAFFFFDPLAKLREGFPPIEELTIQRVVLNDSPNEFVVSVVNGGPEPVTVAQVLVDDAYWSHEVTPSRTIEPLRSATVRIDYPWVEGEPHEIVLITESGVTFEHEVEVSVTTPTADLQTFALLGLLGVYVGVLPVGIGLLWYPWVRRLGARWVSFLLMFTAGILVFLAFDATVEAIELAPAVPGAFRGTSLLVVSIGVALATLLAVGGRSTRKGQQPSALVLATLIAVGIGLHNLGEGLAIGAAYSLGEVALTSLLVVGFTIHNATEGLGIVASLSQQRVGIGRLAGLGLIAGAPTIVGSWLGGIAYNPGLAIAFLGLGVGAILQVVWELASLVRARGRLVEPLVLAGFVAGMIAMYLTAILVVA
ncbi:MAG: metal transporter [Actinomycetota bacterium]